VGKGPKQDLGMETKIIVSSLVELPISVVGESPCRQVDSLLVSRLLRPRQKVLNMDTDFLLDPIKLMNEKRRRKICTLLAMFVLVKS
jgi:hypothetical protein